MFKALARRRVTLGFIVGLLCFWFAAPTARSILLGALLALPGEALRMWAAGHLDKGREITRSGPYRFVRHPLYVGSSIMAVGFVVAASSVAVALLVAGYMTVTLVAAMRTEELALDEKFKGEYTAYRERRAEPVERAFSVARVMVNREYRAAIGVLIGLGLLALKVIWD